MIVILSEKGDMSTHEVIDWLSFFNAPYMRLNHEDAGTIRMQLKLSEKGNDFNFSIGEKTFSLKELDACWYRRGGLPVFKIENKIRSAFPEEIHKDIRSYLNNEASVLYGMLHYMLAKAPVRIGSQSSSSVNKLQVLEVAQSLGLQIPETVVCMCRSELQEFANRFGSGLITKGIWEGLSVSAERSGYSTFSEGISDSDIAELPEEFFPSLLQEKISKKYELRIFYLMGEFYSMAIFSQADKQTETDFRKYNDKTPNRNIPYNLPIEIREKLHLLMESLDLDTGSIDMIHTPENEYVFLEVNPVGQFGMTSVPCNYYLEKKIAEKLISQ